MKKQKGFTLIELVTSVAVVGILSSTAIPAYNDYTIRSKVSEGLNLSNAAKRAIAETYNSEGRFMIASNQSYGLPSAASINGTYVSNVSVSDISGTITVTYKHNLGGMPSANGTTITLVPTPNGGSLKWNCTGGDTPQMYRPSECR